MGAGGAAAMEVEVSGHGAGAGEGAGAGAAGGPAVTPERMAEIFLPVVRLVFRIYMKSHNYP